MRKSVLSETTAVTSTGGAGNVADAHWLDLEAIAQAEISSEDAQHPFEHAIQNVEPGWRAANPGPQIIRLHFDRPQRIRRIRLEFREDNRERSQEFAVSVTSAGEQRKIVVRQQWNFSPGHSPVQNEDYVVDLPNVSTLELAIDPGRHDRQAIASLRFMGLSA